MFAGPNATPETLRPIAQQIRAAMAAAPPEARRQQIEQTIAGMVRTESLRQGVIDQSLASDNRVSGEAFSELITADLRPDLRNIRVPMTVLWVHPPQAPFGPEQMEQYYRASYANSPQAVVRRIPDSYHFIMFDQPDVFRRELRAFLEAR
jgi:pimeloyl-ACP methyl ester carboxylesterase